MLWIGIALLLALILMAVVRLAPTDAAHWHQPLHSEAPALLCGAEAVRVETDGARVACLIDMAPVAALDRLASIAAATPRTRTIAGSPAEGRVTWETRSLIWGFPDYTTAEAHEDGAGARLDLHARSRFGRSDFGVNGARLRSWLRELAG
ncbi:MAG: DUF1499 domain-containing protein [Pseudorhodobacter sp.]